MLLYRSERVSDGLCIYIVSKPFTNFLTLYAPSKSVCWGNICLPHLITGVSISSEANSTATHHDRLGVSLYLAIMVQY